MSRADSSLRIQLDELQGWLRGLSPAAHAPTWSRVLLIESSQVYGKPGNGQQARLRKDELRTPVAFEPRWTELVAEGRTSWINLSALGIWGDALVVVVEPPTQGELGRFVPNQISVNFSGPPAGSDWTVLSRIDLA